MAAIRKKLVIVGDGACGKDDCDFSWPIQSVFSFQVKHVS